jgi:hypothetical protein
MPALEDSAGRRKRLALITRAAVSIADGATASAGT